LAASATPMGAVTADGSLTETEGFNPFVGAISAGAAVEGAAEVGTGSVTVVVVMVVTGTVSEGAPLGLALIPARPASLIPAVGGGLGKEAFGVMRMGPPNGPLYGVDWLVDWASPEIANTMSAATSRILRDIKHP
jgi:hypothetical protein